MNREQVMERIAPLTELTTRRISHEPTTRIVVTPEMVTLRPGGGARTLQLSNEGIVGMASFSGIPKDMASSLSCGTMERVATELLSQKGQYDVLLRDGRVIDFTRPYQYNQVNPERVLGTIERVIPNADYHRVLTLPGHAVSLEVVGDRQVAVAVGDVVQAGSLVTFSPIGTIEPLVQSYVLRLACTNGATSRDVLREFHFGGEGDDVWHFFRESVRDSYRAVDRIVRRFQQMREEQIPPGDRAMVLQAMIKEAGIPKEAADVVRTLAIESPPATAYDVMNLITYASSHLLRDVRQVVRARAAAADFADETDHRRLCPTCRRTR